MVARTTSARAADVHSRTVAATGMRRTALAVLALLITYGSLYPFHFAMPVSHGAAWEKLLFDWTPFTSRGDALGNFALFLPFGFAGVFAAPGRARAAPGVLTILFLSF